MGGWLHFAVRLPPLPCHVICLAMVREYINTLHKCNLKLDRKKLIMQGVIKLKGSLLTNIGDNMSKLYNGEVNINIGNSKNGKVVRVYTDLKPGMEVYSNEKGNVEAGLKKALKAIKDKKATGLDTYSFWVETLTQKGKAVLCYHKAIKGRVQIKREDPNRVQSSDREDI